MRFAASYGDRAHLVTQIAMDRKLGKRLVRGHPMLEAEVVYAVRHEYCESAEDFIARRTRLAFLDVDACKLALPRVPLLPPPPPLLLPPSFVQYCCKRRSGKKFPS